MFMTKTEIQNHIEDRSTGWYDQLVNEGLVSNDLLREAKENGGKIEIGYDFGTLTIDDEGYIVAWYPLNDTWNEE